jgi:hypothetical protein
MNKSGQIFLIAAIIFAVAIYSVAIEYNTLKEYPALNDYKDISQNYQNEYPKVVNYAVFSGQNVSTVLDSFNTAFLKEAQKKDPNFGVFYAYKDTQGNLHIVNTLNNKVLNIKYTGIDGNDVTVKLLSSGTSAPGEICVTGIGCSSTTSTVGNYDAGYYGTDINAAKILPTTVEITDADGFKLGEFDLTEFSSLTYSQSTEEITPQNTLCPDSSPECSQISVSIKQY